jgi:hypothetical protein
MTHLGFGHLWMQEDLSDVNIMISVVSNQAPVDDEAAEAQHINPTILQQLPGHKAILSSSPLFAAQASICSAEFASDCDDEP